jgi:hypothetical protein
MLTSSSAKVSEIAEGNTSTVASAAGSALINEVWAEAGSAIKEIANIPVANRNLDTFILAVYLR